MRTNVVLWSSLGPSENPVYRVQTGSPRRVVSSENELPTGPAHFPIPPQAARQRHGSCSQITSPSPPDLACRAKPFHSAMGFHIMWLNNETLNQPERKVYSNIWLLSLLTWLWGRGQTQLTCSVQWLPFKNYASHSCWAQHITGRCRYNPWRTLSKECVFFFFRIFHNLTSTKLDND